jgi:hypothetical protein
MFVAGRLRLARRFRFRSLRAGLPANETAHRSITPALRVCDCSRWNRRCRRELPSSIPIRSEIMTRTLTAIATAATLAATSVALPSSADARIRGFGIAAGVIGGLAAAAIIGSAVSGGYYYGNGYAYAPYYDYGYTYAPAYSYAPDYGYAYAPGYAYTPGYYGYRYRRDRQLQGRF